MRAIIRVKTNIQDERLHEILKARGWLPRITKAEVLERRKKEILDTIHPDDLEVVIETLLPYIVLDDPTKTWGIVNRPADDLVTFRLKNPIPDRLKTATEKLIRDLQLANEKDVNFAIESKIEVLEPGGDMHAFSGTVLPKNRFALAVQRRQNEWWVGVVAFIASLILLIATVPPIQGFLGITNATEWGAWNLGFLERLSTSTIVTATVSWLNIILYWFDLRRQTAIVWEA